MITEAGTDRRFKLDGEVVNFYVHYEIDDETVKTILRMSEYGGAEDMSWVLLGEAAADAGGEAGPSGA